MAFIALVLVFVCLPFLQRPQQDPEVQTFSVAEQVAAEGDQDDPPQTGWRAVQLPDSWRFTGPKINGAVWYRFTWHGPPAADGVALMAPWVAFATEVRFNGETLFKSRHMSEPLDREFARPIYAPIPNALINPDINVILVKVVGRVQFDPGLGPITIGPRQDVYRQWKWETAYRRDLLFVTIGSLLSGLVISSVLWLAQRSETHHFWFTVTSLAWLWLAQDTLSDSSWPFSNLADFARASAISFPIVVFGLWRAILSFFGQHHRALDIALAAYLAVSIGLVLGAPEPFLGAVIDFNTVLGGALIATLSAAAIWATLRKPIPEYVVFAFAMGFSLLTITHDVFASVGIISDGHSFLFLSGGVFAVGGAVAFGLRYAGAIDRLEAFNEELREAVRSAQSEMKQTLGRERSKAVAEAKLGERMLVAYDLQAGLHGTLEDAIENLERNPEALPPEDFLTVLRGLRDDLDLIFESHADQSASARPLNEILAPMRQRWVLTFGLEGVACFWPDKGDLGPDLGPARNLDLMRVINEALNNALTHANARTVKVSYDTDGAVLTVRIEDDGQGFDPKQAQTAPGLRSMRAWATRLGAAIDIKSRPGAGVRIRMITPIRAPSG